jgi:pilus assembly protein CpaF
MKTNGFGRRSGTGRLSGSPPPPSPPPPVKSAGDAATDPAAVQPPPDDDGFDAVHRRAKALVEKRLDGDLLDPETRNELAEEISPIFEAWLEESEAVSDPQRLSGLIGRVFRDFETVASMAEEAPDKDAANGADKGQEATTPREATDGQKTAGGRQSSRLSRRRRANGAGSGSKKGVVSTSKASVETAKESIAPILMERIDAAAAAKLTRDDLAAQISDIVTEILFEEKIRLNSLEHRELVTKLLNDMLGLGPLEPLLADDSVNDILVNGHDAVFVERSGKLEATDVIFRDDGHVLNIATRIVTRIGRRVDESSPLCDARLADGSRVNIIIPPLAVDGPSISIRKFSKQAITLDQMVKQQNLSREIAVILQIAARSRLNILISGGTGSGKTTLLNAISAMIDDTERIVTIEDAAELKLQQPHIVRLETRPPNLEGEGEITMRDLVKNSLRMRPDRIIVGEVRSSEAVDMLQAMNTGHEGSLGTVHANRPREALTRLENMVGMAGINLPSKAVRTQIASALDMIVQVSRMRDGMRRITSVMEVVGMEGEVITTQELVAYKYEGEDSSGRLVGKFESMGLRPAFTPKAQYFGLDKALLEVI